MSVATSVALPISPLALCSPATSRSSSLAGRPRKPSPLRRSSTPDESEQTRTSTTAAITEVSVGLQDDEEHKTENVMSLQSQLGDRSEDVAKRMSETSAAPTSAETDQFDKTSVSQAVSNSSEVSPKTISNGSAQSPAQENATISVEREPLHQLPAAKTISNSNYSLPPIRPTPKFPHSAPIRPLRPLSKVSGGGGGFGSPHSVPHAGAAQVPQRQKIIVPSKSWKACFDLNLTQKELARFD